MDLPEFRAQLEEELDWRFSEIRFFQNLSQKIATPEEQNQYRRALVLLLYSHFEGYCKFALTLYVSAINSIGLVCSQVNSAVAAASLHDIFVKLRDNNGKAPEFRNELPDDSKLHRFALDREFIERSAEIMARPIKIPSAAVNTESNLKPVVLRKNLYRLGLPHDQFKDLESSIDQLLESRNGIAHGSLKGGVKEETYEKFSRSALKIMNEITTGITKAFDEKWYLAK